MSTELLRALNVAEARLAVAEQCTHEHYTSRDYGFSGSVGQNENRAAHGNICRHYVCHCGAERLSNVNGRHTETTGWLLRPLYIAIRSAKLALAIAKQQDAANRAAVRALGVEIIERQDDEILLRFPDGCKWASLASIRSATKQPDTGDGLVPFYRGLLSILEA